MIKVAVELDQGRITYLKVKGHAEYDEYGKDLVCAGVSSIMFGLMNAIDMTKEDAVIKDDGNQIEIINNADDLKIDAYLELAVIQLKTIEESYSQYLMIDERRK